MVRALRRAPLFFASLALVALLAGVAVPGLSAQSVDLSGDWEFMVQSPNGAGTRQATLVQVGDSISGTISSDRATGDVTGAVEGERVTLNALLMMSSGPFEVVYEAEYTAETMTGTVNFGSYGTGTFTARKVSGPDSGEGTPGGRNP